MKTVGHEFPKNPSEGHIHQLTPTSAKYRFSGGKWWLVAHHSK